jgi:hypothetical protein
MEEQRPWLYYNQYGDTYLTSINYSGEFRVLSYLQQVKDMLPGIITQFMRDGSPTHFSRFVWDVVNNNSHKI